MRIREWGHVPPLEPDREDREDRARRAVSDQVDELRCAECGREPRDDENAADEWRAYRDVDDELPVFCPECAKREFS